MTMVRMLVSQLAGHALDWAVALAVAGKPVVCGGSVPRWKFPALDASVWADDAELGDLDRYSPSTVWSDGGPLIETYRVDLVVEDSGEWWAAPCFDGGGSGAGASPLVALCRAVVATRFGESVEVPAELVEGATDV